MVLTHLPTDSLHISHPHVPSHNVDEADRRPLVLHLPSLYLLLTVVLRLLTVIYTYYTDLVDAGGESNGIE